MPSRSVLRISWIAALAIAVGTLGGLGCEDTPPWGVRINGAVSVQHGGEELPLAFARVVIRDQKVGGWGKRSVLADATGRYDLEFEHRYGDFEMCAEGNGLPLTCNPKTVRLYFAGSRPPTRDVAIVPGSAGALLGQNLLADGTTPCAEPLQVELWDQGSPPQLVTSGQSTPDGRWALGDLPAFDAVELRVHCAALTYAKPFLLDDSYRKGEATITDVLPNHPPVIDSLRISDAMGTIQKTIAPDSSATLTATVTQGDLDPLTYSWSDSADAVPDIDAPSVDWTTPAAPQLDVIHVTVDDGRGGVASASLQLRIGAAEDVFIGHVLDAETGAPVAGATVDVDGSAAMTDANGLYALAVTAASSHVLRVSADGFADHVERLEGGAPGHNVELDPLTRFTVDPTQDIEIWDGTRGVAVFIPANSLEDAGGGIPSGLVDVDVHTRDGDTDRPRGSRVARDAGSSEQVLQPIQSAAIEISDASGRIYNLKSGAQATIGFQAPDIPPGNLPAVYPLLHLNEASGEWEEEGEVALVGSRYEGPVSSFSAWSTGSYAATSQACVRIEVKGGVQLPQLLRVYWWDPPSDYTQHLIDEYTVQEHENVLFRLPENVQLILELAALDSPSNTLGIAGAATGGGVSPSEPPYPWTPCQEVAIGAEPPAELGGSSTTKYLNRILGSQASALSYYLSINALTEKDTFQKWLDANQFPVGASGNDVTFFNPNELGLTRRANCNKYSVGGVDQYACYVTKFGKLGEAPQASLWDGFTNDHAGDTVAMEFSNDPSLGGQRGVKFYIYGPGLTPAQQPIKLKTTFDTDGETKYVPDVCLHCHGVYSPQFVVFDLHQYEYLGFGQSHLPNVQEQVRVWNSWVDEIAQANPPPWLPAASNPARSLLAEIYGGQGAVHVPGTLAGPGLTGDPLYDEIAKPYCRTCHMWGGWQFAYPDPFNAQNTNHNMQGPAYSHICTGVMPNAMGPQLALWSSSNPFLPSILPGLGCATFNNPPVPTIYAPSPGTDVGFGGLSLATYQASSADVEDGPGCCLFEWTSDEGVMGYGHTIQHTFATSGTHEVCVTITDSGGSIGQDCIEVDSNNDDPSAVIHDPVPLQQILVGQPYVFFGQAFDVNEPYLQIPCEDLFWDFPGAATAPIPSTATGCHPVFTFTAQGVVTARLFGTDSQNAFDTDTVLINVVPLPPGSPPGVAITNPDEGNLYPPDDVLDLTAIVTSNGGGAISLDWTADWGAGPVTISTVNPDTWVPSDDVPFNCGGQDVTVQLEASDSNGTSATSVDIEISYPPC